jgi:Glyoxalase-like domain
VSVQLDHLVIAAATLEQGAAWCEATMGVAPQPGGQHPLFGTHNRLLKIASAAYPECYLEIIAIDPAAPPPQRARWFGLGDEALQASLASNGPRLIHCVARSTMLDMHRWGLITVGCQPGDPVSASRETKHGTLNWQILVREDGALLCGGALPTLIQWQGTHPASHMPDSGVTLTGLKLNGVPHRARDVLRLRGVDVQPTGEPALSATLATPRGPVTLHSAP